jgi:transcriptional activator protein UGA3
MGDSVDTSLHACHSFSTSQCREARKPRRRAGTTRERLGCLTCRIRFESLQYCQLMRNYLMNMSRRKKCDELYPICGHCRRLNLVCKREEPRKIVPESPQAHDRGLHIKTSQSLKISRRNFISNIPKPIDSSPFNHPVHIGKGQDRRAFLSYYTQVLAVILTTSHDNNSFLSGSFSPTSPS